ncbi:MAG TPA: hypothetical protein VGB71_08055 [Flavisolibacter sp.]|jgi:hypothetical protein
METIKGYVVQVWSTDLSVDDKKSFTDDDLLSARRSAFKFAEDLVDMMHGANGQDFTGAYEAENILSPSMAGEDLVFTNIQVNILYEGEGGETTEALIYAPQSEEFDLANDDMVEQLNKESACYTSIGYKDIVAIQDAGINRDKTLHLLKDDFKRLEANGELSV